jgi:hypothetical protein
MTTLREEITSASDSQRIRWRAGWLGDPGRDRAPDAHACVMPDAVPRHRANLHLPL